MKDFRTLRFAATAALPLISTFLIAAAWIRVNDMAPPAWFVPSLILTDALPLGINCIFNPPAN